MKGFFFFSLLFLSQVNVHQNILWIYEVWKHPIRLACLYLLVTGHVSAFFLKDITGIYAASAPSCIPKGSNPC